MRAPLLIELLTEELPPKALRRLSEAFAQGLHEGLVQQGLMTARASVHVFATPRRLAVLLDDEGDAAAAAATVRALMFVARFREDLLKRLEALDAG